MTTQPPVAPPTCYRHGSRETHIRCTRCDKPICPDCMNAAAVGFQCPDCVREGNRTVRQGQTVFGGSIAGERGTVTYVLIAINIAMYVLNLIWALALGANPGQIGQIAYSGGGPVLEYFATTPSVAAGEFYRLITADFVHIGILHIALNMYGLWVLGRETERLVGRWRFLALYLLAGLGGTTAIYFFGSAGAGASASIFGLFGALIFFFRKLKANLGGLLTVIVLNVVITFWPGTNISILGHVGGFIAGAVLGLGLAYAPRGQWRLPVQIGTLVGVGLVLAVLVALRTAAYGLLA